MAVDLRTIRELKVWEAWQRNGSDPSLVCYPRFMTAMVQPCKCRKVPYLSFGKELINLVRRRRTQSVEAVHGSLSERTLTVDGRGKDTVHQETSHGGEENANVNHDDDDSEACVLTLPWPSAGGLGTVVLARVIDVAAPLTSRYQWDSGCMEVCHISRLYSSARQENNEPPTPSLWAC